MANSVSISCLEVCDLSEVGVSYEPEVSRSCDRVGKSGKVVALSFLTLSFL